MKQNCQSQLVGAMFRLVREFPWDDQQDSCGVKKIFGSSGLIEYSSE